MPKFSIIIPTYEHTELLQRALQSVMMQNYADWEVIISDDSKSNDVKSYIEGLQDKRINCLKHQKGETAAENWNYGIQAAKGDYIILMHHDEVFKETVHLQLIAKAFESGVHIVITNIEIDKYGRISAGKPLWLKKFALSMPSLLFLCNTIGPTACIAFRRERMQIIDDRLRWLVDAEWYFRLLKGNNILFLENLSIRSYHGHNGQLSLSLNSLETFKADQVIINKTYGKNTAVKCMTALYGWLIIRIKQIIGKL